MVTNVDEPIRVAAVFTKGEILPVWFDRRGIQVRVHRIAFSWRTQEGSASLMHFSVTDGNNLYEISFNTQTMGWCLEATEAP